MSELAAFRLRIMRPSDLRDLVPDEQIKWQIEEAILEAEENVSDMLPLGYYCKIEEENPQ